MNFRQEMNIFSLKTEVYIDIEKHFECIKNAISIC